MLCVPHSWMPLSSVSPLPACCSLQEIDFLEDVPECCEFDSTKYGNILFRTFVMRSPLLRILHYSGIRGVNWLATKSHRNISALHAEPLCDALHCRNRHSLIPTIHCGHVTGARKYFSCNRHLHCLVSLKPHSFQPYGYPLCMTATVCSF
ncbi:hypothetical protein PHLGIDRAFT_251821 [Phlebiopsis gigantea 11061_1 CR5-6]|uniref:Uncharacterized protein n=1 Tax=Phlebiopsis gigantea (strain 11061_1 CR5-6) TaxID=745531 RepID=A0A0C3S4X8_PHLG1|nr:hypothetical protein PHLGIDRAFT_251821 [Phlebiopsis gigantea 11061_1 CR5-6]